MNYTFHSDPCFTMPSTPDDYWGVIALQRIAFVHSDCQQPGRIRLTPNYAVAQIMKALSKGQTLRTASPETYESMAVYNPEEGAVKVAITNYGAKEGSTVRLCLHNLPFSPGSPLYYKIQRIDEISSIEGGLEDGKYGEPLPNEKDVVIPPVVLPVDGVILLTIHPGGKE